MFFGKRDRIFKGGWRHGITGVEDADSDNGSVFYKEHHDLKMQLQHEKDLINRHRKRREFIIIDQFYRTCPWFGYHPADWVRFNWVSAKSDNNRQGTGACDWHQRYLAKQRKVTLHSLSDLGSYTAAHFRSSCHNIEWHKAQISERKSGKNSKAAGAWPARSSI